MAIAPFMAVPVPTVEERVRAIGGLPRYVFADEARPRGNHHALKALWARVWSCGGDAGCSAAFVTPGPPPERAASRRARRRPDPWWSWGARALCAAREGRRARCGRVLLRDEERDSADCASLSDAGRLGPCTRRRRHLVGASALSLASGSLTAGGSAAVVILTESAVMRNGSLRS